MATFARGVAAYLDVDEAQILAHVRNCRRRKLDQYRAEAREMIRRRGSVAKILGEFDCDDCDRLDNRRT